MHPIVRRPLQLLMISAALALPARASWLDRDLIGEPLSVLTEFNDTLLDLGRTYDAGYVEMRIANPGVDPWLPGAGTRITLPTQHIIPEAPRRGIVINVAELRLYFFPQTGPPQSFPIGIGREGWETPLGRTAVASKKKNPSWVPTASEHEENPDLPQVVPPGPDNPMGELALYLALRGYAIHGTNRPYSIGRRDSHGCIRLYPEDIAKLFEGVAAGTPVTVVDQQVKFGWGSGRLYVEAHPSQSDADAIETNGVAVSPPPGGMEERAIRAAGNYAAALDRAALSAALERRDGIPTPITPPVSFLPD
jgi:L,D-transpeptidase ErfK/SrfK